MNKFILWVLTIFALANFGTSIAGLVGGNNQAVALTDSQMQVIASKVQSVLGATGTRYPNGVEIGANASSTNLSTTGALVLGARGNGLYKFVGTNCTLIGTDTSQAASTTLPYDCVVPGAVSSDLVLAQLASSTASAGSGQQFWAIVGSKASTTAGYVTVLLYNNGTARVPSATSVGSTTPIWLYKN